MSDYRISGKGRVDSTRPVNFTFDGKRYQGLQGDTVASALLSQGVHLMGRSFKYHRPRGPVAAGSEEPNALIGTRRGPGRFEPNTRATVQEIWEGLEATSQNKYPSLKWDIGAVNDAAYMLFSAGFYYKTFMWPKSFWDKVYEPFIRAAAGLGVSPTEEDPDNYASRYLHCDVLVVGGGPAGLAAAHSAAVAGAKVVLVDEHAEMGGSILSDPDVRIDGAGSWTWLASRLAELRALGVRLMTRTTAIGYYHQNMIGMVEKLTDHLPVLPKDTPRERMWRVRAGRVVLAQGALEKPLVFHGNDRPGVMLAGSAQTYLNRYGVLVGRRPVALTSHDSAWYAAFDMADAGAKVQAIVDTRETVRDDLLADAKARGIKVKLSHTATATWGRLRVTGLRVNPVNDAKVGSPYAIHCDTVLMSGGWTPSLHLFSHTKGSLTWDDEQTTFLPKDTPEDCHIAGASRGLWGYEAALVDGDKAGMEAARAAGFKIAKGTFRVAQDRVGSGISHKELPTDRSPGKAKAFVDYQNDVTA